MMLKKVLILYSRTGGGHLRAAENIAVELQSRGLKVVLHDGLVKTDLGVRVSPGRSYALLSTYLLPIYNLGYRITSSKAGLKGLRRMIRQTWGKSYSELVESEKPDLVVSTHHFMTPSTFQMHPKVPFVIVVTDLGRPHQLWFDNQATVIVVADEEMANYAKKQNHNQTAVEVLGYPMRRDLPKPRPKKRFTNTILLLASGLSVLSVNRYLDRLFSEMPQIKVIVAGASNQLIKKLAGGQNRLEVHGFVDNLPELIIQSDIVVTKAGPGTILETVALHRPLIIVKGVGLQEKDNITFVTSKGLGVYCPKAENFADYIKTIYQSYSQFTQHSKIETSGSRKIADFVIKQLV